jgi:3-oxoacyl-[acyl-carrier protein] reductase
MSHAGFDRTMAVNVRAPFFAMQEAARHMRAGGRIITVSSNAAVSAAVPASSVYGLSKSAVTAMTRSLAHDHSARVNGRLGRSPAWQLLRRESYRPGA